MMKKNIKVRSIQKRSFLLFEVLLSLTLLISIFFPMLKSHFSLVQEEVKTIERIRFGSVKESSFSEIKEFLYENRLHTFSELQSGVKGELPKKVEIDFGEGKKKSYRRMYQITPLEYCYKKSTNDKYLLIEVILTFVAHEKERGRFTTIYLIEEHA